MTSSRAMRATLPRRRASLQRWSRWLLLLPLLAMAPATAMECPQLHHPEVEIQLHSELHSIDRSRTIAELSSLKPSPSGLHSNGLYSAARQGRLEVGYTTSSDGHQACVAVERLRIDVGYKRRVIHIAREYPPDSCESRAVLEHELKHLGTDDRLLAAAAPDIRVMLAEAARHAHLGPIPLAEAERARERLKQELDTKFARELAVFDDRRAKAQNSIDVDAEYERVRRQCPTGWRAR